MDFQYPNTPNSHDGILSNISGNFSGEQYHSIAAT